MIISCKAIVFERITQIKLQKNETVATFGEDAALTEESDVDDYNRDNARYTYGDWLLGNIATDTYRTATAAVSSTSTSTRLLQVSTKEHDQISYMRVRV